MSIVTASAVLRPSSAIKLFPQKLVCDLEAEDGRITLFPPRLPLSSARTHIANGEGRFGGFARKEDHLGVEDVGEARHAAAHRLVLLLFWVPGCHEERGEPACLSALAPPCPNRHQVQGVPQTLTVVPGTEKGRWETWVLGQAGIEVKIAQP